MGPRVHGGSVQVMLHHAVDNELVRYGGCCNSESCCCNIGADRDKCVSTDSSFASWAEKVRAQPHVRKRSGCCEFAVLPSGAIA